LRAVAVLIIAAILYVLLVAVPEQAVSVESNPVTIDPSEVGLAFEDFVVTPADAELAVHGWWMPAEDPIASLVFIHGGGSNRTSSFFGSLDFYRALVERNISVAAIDLRNHGNSDSDGQGLQFGRTEKYDAMAATAWTRARQPGLPVYIMGISMGGATVIQAVSSGAKVDGLILLDPLLSTDDVFKRGGWVETGLPDSLFWLSSWSARSFFGLPDGEEQALARAASLDVPILAMQDPDDPVTRLSYTRQLVASNPNAILWLAPSIPANDPQLAWKGRWGSHVAAFQFFPESVLENILQFIKR
jgi:uncharacterized protein